MRHIISVLLLLGIVLISKAQTIDDVLNFGRDEVRGTARMQGIAGAGVAIGGDMTSAYLNPAGLGMYNRNDLSITPGFTYQENQNAFYNQSYNSRQKYMTLDHLGIVFNNTIDDIEKSEWRGGSFAITYNRLRNFKKTIGYGPITTGNLAMIDDMAVSYSGDEPYEPGAGPFYTNMAYDNYLLNVSNKGDLLAMIPEGTLTRQSGNIVIDGRTHEWNLSYGGNYDDKFYFGLGMGIRSGNYSYQGTHNENYSKPNDSLGVKVGDWSVDATNSTQWDEDINLQLTGLNLNLGFLYRATSNLMLGASLKTGTSTTITGTEEFTLSGDIDGISKNDSLIFDNYNFTDNPENQFSPEYQLQIPAEYSAGATYFINDDGFLTVNIRYQNFGNHYFSSTEGSAYSGLNDRVKQNFKGALSYQLGGEYRFGVFRARAGYAYEPSPSSPDFKDAGLYGEERKITFGGGVKLPNFYIDVALINKMIDSYYQPYYFSYGATTFNNEKSISRVAITAGYTFK